MADKKYDDRVLASEDETALPKPQIQIIVDGKSVFKPGSCDTVVSTHLVCTCESVSTCSCVGHNAGACSCVAYRPGGGGGGCSCQSVSCGSPCACIPVRVR